MTESNLNIVLTNALCCSSAQAAKVSKLYSIGNSCADEELVKLKLLNDRIEALRCYVFGTATNSEYTFYGLDEALWGAWIAVPEGPLGDPDLNTVSLTVNGILYTIPGDGTSTSSQLIIAKLTELGFYVSYSYVTNGFTDHDITFILTCEVTSLNIQVYTKPAKLYPFTNTVIGGCGIEQNTINCLTELQQDAIAHQIMATCEICDCQLTQ